MANALKVASETEFLIEKNIPMPYRARSYTKYPFPSMEVGDSFFVSDVAKAPARGAANAWGTRNGVKFATRAVNGGIRIWRTA